ncbi:unnamed protein product [Amoebophrya sp. A25]|nr:unnamed protein product [Amoebophrya sp. A25]|eukprot:GSA25T00011961001.1
MNFISTDPFLPPPPAAAAAAGGGSGAKTRREPTLLSAGGEDCATASKEEIETTNMKKPQQQIHAVERGGNPSTNRVDDDDAKHEKALSRLQAGDTVGALAQLEEVLREKLAAKDQGKDEAAQLGEKLAAKDQGKEAAQSAFILGMLYLQQAKREQIQAAMASNAITAEEKTRNRKENPEPEEKNMDSCCHQNKDCSSETFNNGGSETTSEKAVSRLKLALSLREEYCGAQHPATLVSVGACASALEGAGRTEEALEFHRRAVAGALQVLGDSHENTAYAYMQFGSCLLTPSSSSPPTRMGTSTIRQEEEEMSVGVVTEERKKEAATAFLSGIEVFERAGSSAEVVLRAALKVFDLGQNLAGPPVPPDFRKKFGNSANDIRLQLRVLQDAREQEQVTQRPMSAIPQQTMP